MPPRRTLPRTMGLALAGLVLLLLAASWARDRGLPRHDGASARTWLERYARETARTERGHFRLEPWLESKLAFVSMGTSSIPFLVDRAFRYQPDSAFRERLRLYLHQKADQLPDWINDQLVLPRSELDAWSAAELLLLLRPPAEALLTELSPHFADTNLLSQRILTFLLGTAGHGASNVVPHLVRALEQDTDPIRRHQAMNALVRFGPTAAPALPAVARVYARSNTLSVESLALLAARVGPEARILVPLLESSLGRTNIREHPYHKALALRRIDPTHQKAESMLLPVATAPTPDTLERMGLAPPSPRTSLARAVLEMDAGTEAWLADLLTLWFEEEIQTWADPWNGNPVLTDALERVNPVALASILERARDRPQSRLAVAARLLCIHPGDETAAAVLLAILDSNSSEPLEARALTALGAASSSNHPALQRLREWARTPPPPPPFHHSQRLAPGEVQRLAREALARIRYREALIAYRASTGFPITESWARVDPMALP